MPALQPIVLTPDLDRLAGFYTALLGAEQVSRVPASGPAFFVGLRIGDSELSLVGDTAAPMQAPQRMLLSAEVADVDALQERVTALGGQLRGLPNDMPWGQRVLHAIDPDGNGLNLVQPM